MQICELYTIWKNFAQIVLEGCNMQICEPYTIGAYVVFWYGWDECGDVYLVDEIWHFSFDEALKEVHSSWGLPFEICRFEKFDKESRTYYKRVARSKEFAIM